MGLEQVLRGLLYQESEPQTGLGALYQSPSPAPAPTGLLGALYTNPLMARQVAAQRAANPRPNVTADITHGETFNDWLNWRTRTLMEQMPHEAILRGEMPMFGIGGMTKKLPKVYDAFHGTKSEVKNFDLRHAGASDHGLVGRAVYLTPSAEQASHFAMSQHYGRGTSPNVMPVKVSLSNPLIVKDGVLPDGRSLSALHPQGITKESAESARKWMVDQGYDGVVFEVGGEVTQIAAFDSKAVRSKFEK